MKKNKDSFIGLAILIIYCLFSMSARADEQTNSTKRAELGEVLVAQNESQSERENNNMADKELGARCNALKDWRFKGRGKRIEQYHD